jgi:hypothetical protein
MSESKYFIIDGKIEVRLAVSGKDEGDAKKKAKRMVSELLEGSFVAGWNFDTGKVTEISIQ